jgi:hypothetical protein
MSLLWIDTNTGGTPGDTIFIDGTTYQPLFSRSTPGEEKRWHPLQPDNMVYVSGNVLGRWNVRTDASATIRTLSEYSKLQIGPYEGNLSANGSLIALLATMRPIRQSHSLTTWTRVPSTPISA